MMNQPKIQTIVNPMIATDDHEYKEDNGDKCICLVLCAALFSI
jgi:hypothetical protein